VQPLIEDHLGADRVTPEALVVEQERPVVALSAWLADAAAVAGRTGRVLQVLTPGTSRITYPLELLLAQAGRWVVRHGSGFRDGLTGEPVRWTGERFAAAGPRTPQPVARAAGGGLEVSVVHAHRAAADLQLGAVATAVVAALTGGAPRGWGVAEPATQPWSARELTRHCRGRAPEPTAVVMVGDGAVGRMLVTRTEGGVVEELRLAGPAATGVRTAQVEALADALGGAVRRAVVGVHPARADGLRVAGAALPALPFGLLVGAEAVGERGAEHAAAAPASTVRLVGGGAWCRFDGGEVAPFEQLTAVLAHFGMPT
jgi:hypothetical protein